MARKLKVYGTLVHLYDVPSPDGRKLRGQMCAVVSATSQKEAAKLLGVSLSDFRWNGAETSHAESVELANANPGRVIVWPEGIGRPGSYHFLPPIEWQEANVRAVEARERGKAEMKARIAEMEAEHEARKARNAEADRAAREMIEREQDILDELGLTLTTDGKGNCTLPVETIIGLAIQAMR